MRFSIYSVNCNSNAYAFYRKGKLGSVLSVTHIIFLYFASQELQDTAADVIGVDKYHQVRVFSS